MTWLTLLRDAGEQATDVGCGDIYADVPDPHEGIPLIVLARNLWSLLVAVAEAAEALSIDEESQEGGWGPDVTMLIPLPTALAALRAAVEGENG